MKTLNAVLTVFLAIPSVLQATAKNGNLEWLEKNGKKYWLENGEIQGAVGDQKNIVDEIYGIERGREIYDPDTDAWYWLDACYGGAKAESKEVWIPYVFQDEAPGSTEGKWVRYDEEGKMVKGWFIDEDRVYYYDRVTGAMAKQFKKTEDGLTFFFDPVTGVLSHLEDGDGYALLIPLDGNRMNVCKETYTSIEKTELVGLKEFFVGLGNGSQSIFLDESKLNGWQGTFNEKRLVYLDGYEQKPYVYFISGMTENKEEMDMYMEAISAEPSSPIEENHQLHKALYSLGDDTMLYMITCLSMAVDAD